ncbi:uncharacterized protein LOC141614202 [Silene latifolia]|uniref:uncharacterized protein LOC141614202 n=1 Tax=Silene latifolia TaxID=37657 RepID=UPI003D78260C
MGSCGFWNVRGLNSPNKQYEIKRFLHHNKVGLFGLIETKIKSSRWNKVKNSLCDNWAICTNSSMHRGGRIWLLWDPTMFIVDVKDVTAQTIHAEVQDKLRSRSFWITLVYGFNKAQERTGLWNSIRKYHRYVTGPWITCGDFNNVLAANERIGGAEVTRAEIVPMAKVVHECNFHDLKGNGSFYTWNNKHEHGGKIYSRIDRVLINDDWINMFPESVANFLPEGLFDHCPCLINFELQMVRRSAAFKYFNMWALAKNFEEVVSTVWSKEVNGTPMFRVVTRLKKLKGELKKLNKEQFSDIENLTNVAELALKEAQTKLIMDPLNEEMCQAERLCATEFEELQKARNMYLKQKAKEAWVANGDENTAFFHSSIRKRRSQNRVYQIKDMHHNVCNSNVAIQAAFEEFYKSLLGDSKEVCPVNKVIVRKREMLNCGPQGEIVSSSV